MKKKFVVELEMPVRATVSEVKAYIRDAVGSMKGCYHPDDPMFHLDGDSVKVTSFSEARAARTDVK